MHYACSLVTFCFIFCAFLASLCTGCVFYVLCILLLLTSVIIDDDDDDYIEYMYIFITKRQHGIFYCRTCQKYRQLNWAQITSLMQNSPVAYGHTCGNNSDLIWYTAKTLKNWQIIQVIWSENHAMECSGKNRWWFDKKLNRPKLSWRKLFGLTTVMPIFDTQCQSTE